MPIYSGGSSGASGGVGKATLRKVTSKTVNTTIAETDLLNGEITIPALAATDVLVGYLWGDWKQNSGANASPPTFALKYGGTTLISSGNGAAAANAINSATRFAWTYEFVIAAANATNAQTATVIGHMGWGCAAGTTTADNSLVVGEGIVSSMLGANGKAIAITDGFSTAAVDSTAARALLFTTTNASASASYEVVLFGAIIVQY